MNSAVLKPEAAEELLAAYEEYERHRDGLGGEFLGCVDAAIESACRDPEAYPIVHREVRRVLVRRFPYGVFYRLREQTTVVLAVFHARREPGEWKRRA